MANVFEEYTKNQYPFGGLFPVNIPAVVRGVGRLLGNRMYNTVKPTGYSYEQVKNFANGTPRTSYGNPNVEALYGKYTGQDSIIADYTQAPEGLPVGRVLTQAELERLGTDNPTLAKYATSDLVVPSRSKEGAFELAYPNQPGNVPHVPYSYNDISEGRWAHSHELGTYYQDKGADGQGSYITYEDTWDINPFRGKSSSDDPVWQGVIGIGKKVGADRLGNVVPFGKPFEVYGKQYYGKNGKPVDTKGTGGYLDHLRPKDAWDRLPMDKKAEMMGIAVRNGITDLPTIRKKYNEFAEGGRISDREYYETMEKVAEENNPKWNQLRTDEGGRPLSVDEEYLRILNDPTYNYRAYYDKYPDSRANADTHWTDEFKTAYHPTFSTQSIYSGQKSQYNPYGYLGGWWNGEQFVPQFWQMNGNMYAGGGSTTDDDLVDFLIKEEGFTSKPTDIGDGKLTLGSGLTAQKWHNLYQKRGNKWSAADNRMAVREEVANRRRWAERNIPNWDSLPASSQKALLAYKYNYDFNAVNSPRLFQALKDSNLYEAARQMDATSKDPKFQKGLAARRKREQAWFLSDVGMPDITPSVAPITAPPVSTAVYNLYPIEVQNTTVAPRMVPDEGSYVRAHRLTESEVRRQELQERWDAINRFNNMMRMLDIQNNPMEQFTSTNPMFMGIEGLMNAKGGRIYIKPENRGKLTELKKRTGKTEAELYNDGNPAHKKMVVFARSARKWNKHDMGGYLQGQVYDIPEDEVIKLIDAGYEIENL